MSLKSASILLVVLTILSSAACGTAPSPIPSLPPTLPSPSATPTALPPTLTPPPTETPLPTNTPLPTDTPTPAISPTPYTCSDAIGCLEVPPGAPLRIGYLLDLSGHAAYIGKESLNALQLAMKLQADLYGHPIELVGFDEQCSGEGGRAAGQSLAGDPSLAGIIGPTCSVAGQAAMPWLSQAGLAVITSSSTSFRLTSPTSGYYYPGYYRVIPGDHMQGVAAARFAFEHLKAKKAASVYALDANYKLIHDFFIEEFKKLGGEVVIQEALSLDQTSVDAAVGRIAKAAPEVVFLPVTLTSAVAVIQAARQTPELANTPLVGIENLFSSALSEQAGLASDGFIVSRVDFNPPDDVYETEFLPKYRVEYGGDPTTIFVPFTADAVSLLMAALKQVGVAYPDGTLYIPRQALRDALYGMQDFSGMTGALSCTPQGECADLRSVVFYMNQVGIFPPTERVWP